MQHILRAPSLFNGGVAKQSEKTIELTAVLWADPEGGFCALNPETGSASQGATEAEALANLAQATESTACCNYIPHRQRCLSFPSYRDPTPSGHSSTSGFVVCGRRVVTSFCGEGRTVVSCHYIEKSSVERWPLCFARQACRLTNLFKR
jgi:hypothetical protein